MEITEVKVRLMNRRDDKLRAFVSITLDNAFVVRDLKVIEGVKGTFVAMPSRKFMDRCPKCRAKNELRANFCNECGTKLSPERTFQDAQGRVKFYADIAHPINSQCRELIQDQVLKAYQAELEKAKQPDYKPPNAEDVATGVEDEKLEGSQ